MSAFRRSLLQLAITAALATLFAVLIPVFVDRREFAVAVHSWVTNPTLDNGIVMAQEELKTQRMVRTTRLAVGGGLFVFMNLGWFLVNRRAAHDRERRDVRLKS